ncbi:hypothetical protein LTR49_020447 [Elasticomyces elasticus]|nr:hypothetical protein LTR49_020447 [Elasticomyces elasticus]
MATTGMAANFATTTRQNSEEEVKDTRCRLLELPQELQDGIFELVAIHEAPIMTCWPYCSHYADGHFSSETQYKRDRAQPALSETCRSIRSNVLPIYYKRNTFEICYCGKILRGGEMWLTGIGAANRAMLRRVIAHEMFMWPPYYLLAELGNPPKAGRRLVIEITADNKVSCLTQLADTLDPRAGRTAGEKDLEAVSVIVASRATSRGKVERYEVKLVKMPRCQLLELPEELQLEIYELVVVSENKIRLNRIFCRGYGANVNDFVFSEIETQTRLERTQPAITKTCRRVRNIALTGYYKRNIFEFCSCIPQRPDVLKITKHWLDDMGASNRASLANFRYHEWDSEAGYTGLLPECVQSLAPHRSTLEPLHHGLKFNRYQLNFTQ